MKRWRAFTVLIAAATLTACTSPSPVLESPTETSPPADASPTDSGEPTEDSSDDGGDPAPESSEPTAEDTEAAGGTDPVNIPACDDLLDHEDLLLYFADGADAVELMPTPDNWGPPAEHMMDDNTRSFMEQAQDPRSCTWGLPYTDNFFTIISTPLSAAVAGELEAEIDALGYVQFRPPTPGYSFEVADATASGVHAVVSDVWFLFQGGPGSINADDAQRHEMATILSTAIERTVG